MDWKKVRLIWVFELRTLLRSRRTVVLSIALPLIVVPLMLMATRFTTELRQQRQANATYRYALTGDWTEQARVLIESARRLDRDNPASSALVFPYEEVPSSDPAASVRSGALDFYVDTFSPVRADASWESNLGTSALEETPNPLEARISGVPAIRIIMPGNRVVAATGAQRMAELLDIGRRIESDRVLREQGVEFRLSNLLPLDRDNISTDEQMAGLFVGRLLTILLFMVTLTGGSVAAIDIIAGEKERGTLETLLTTAVGRTEIVAAKQLVILATAVAIAMLQVVNLLVYTQLDILPLPEGFRFELANGALLSLLLMYVPFAVLIAGALLLLSAYAKSYKEAQLYFFPLYLIGMLPAAAGAIGDVPLRSAIALVPVANISVAVRDILTGTIDWWMVVAVFSINSAAAAWLLMYSTTLLEDERLVSARQESLGHRMYGLAVFRAHVLRWYGVMWSVLFLGAAAVPALEDLRAQAFFNEIVILLGGSLVIVRFYGLRMSRALALRRVSLWQWPLFLLLIGPLHLTAALISRLANRIAPLPETYLDQLSQQFNLGGVPSWQLLLFFALLPAICEEVAFRGPLLYGLRRRFSPPVLAVVVGMTFGFFHFTLVRIATTAVIGTVITAVALLTGSIFPGILLHLGNNALALLLAQQGIRTEELPLSIYGFAVTSVAALLWIVYRNRSLYPED
jgi:sodium transport system permease protein